MPVLIPTLPPPAVEVRSLWDEEETAVSQGLEGRQVREQIENVSRHWQQQSLAEPMPSSLDLLDELAQYRHVPFASAGKVRVRFTRITDLKPRQFVFDEDDERAIGGLP